MKVKFSILFLCVSLLATAQKKELRKLEEAIKTQKIDEARDIFNSINESEIEEKYLPAYTFFKSMNLLDNLITQPSLENLRTVEKTFNKSQELGYKNEQLVPYMNSTINDLKFGMVQNLAANNKNEDALSLMEELYQLDTSNKDFLFNSANLAYKSEKYDKAKKYYRELIGDNYTGIKTTYLANNTSTNQIESFPNETLRSAAIKIGTHASPSEEKSLSNLGAIMTRLMWLFKKDGEVSQAQGLLKTVTQKYPNDESLKAVMPEIYNTLDMKDEFKKAVESNKESLKDPSILASLGRSAFEAKNYDQAISYFESSLDIKEDFYSYAMLANSYIEKTNLETKTFNEQVEGYKKAVKYMEEALKLKPDDATIKQSLIGLYTFLNMDEKAAALKK